MMMEGQIGIYDLKGDPDYHGSRDEIVRYSIEHRFELSINLWPCECGESPKLYFRSCEEYFVECPRCLRRTAYHKHAYKAMQAWNRKEYVEENDPMAKRKKKSRQKHLQKKRKKKGANNARGRYKEAE